jgi:hypothetical protein
MISNSNRTLSFPLYVVVFRAQGIPPLLGVGVFSFFLVILLELVGLAFCLKNLKIKNLDKAYKSN